MKPCLIKYYNIASKFVESNSIARACFIFLLCTLMTSANKFIEKKKFSNGLKMLYNNWFIRELCVHRLMKHLGSFESTPEARVALGSSNFSRASYFDERTLTYEPIVNG